jgi:TetR/AcrR family transcriptional repressor of nem operon
LRRRPSHLAPKPAPRQSRGEFRLAAPATKTARLILGALQGGLLVKRTTADASQVRDVVSALKAQLTA